MDDLDVYFIKGLASNQKVLEDANISNVKQVLILANDISDINSDDFTISSCAMIKKLNPSVHVIVEKVRQDATLFEIVGADIIVDSASSSLLAQEILDPGAIELGDAIFSNSTEGTQYNIIYNGEDVSWEDIAISILKSGAIAEGFRNSGEKRFNLLPSLDDIVKKGALVKYRANSKLSKISV
jgi:Trk K+ transport system NAD-binding subunit